MTMESSKKENKQKKEINKQILNDCDGLMNALNAVKTIIAPYVEESMISKKRPTSLDLLVGVPKSPKSRDKIGKSNPLKLPKKRKEDPLDQYLDLLHELRQKAKKGKGEDAYTALNNAIRATRKGFYEQSGILISQLRSIQPNDEKHRENINHAIEQIQQEIKFQKLRDNLSMVEKSIKSTPPQIRKAASRLIDAINTLIESFDADRVELTKKHVDSPEVLRKIGQIDRLGDVEKELSSQRNEIFHILEWLQKQKRILLEKPDSFDYSLEKVINRGKEAVKRKVADIVIYGKRERYAAKAGFFPPSDSSETSKKETRKNKGKEKESEKPSHRRTPSNE